MATTATATLTAGLTTTGIGSLAQFTLGIDTTDADGLVTLDLTAYFGYIHSAKIVGSLEATGYVTEIQKPELATALTSTNLKIGFYEAGADAAALDPVASTDLSAVIKGLAIEVVGKEAATTSWS